MVVVQCQGAAIKLNPMDCNMQALCGVDLPCKIIQHQTQAVIHNFLLFCCFYSIVSNALFFPLHTVAMGIYKRGLFLSRETTA